MSIFKNSNVPSEVRIKQITTMMEMQDAMNSKVNPDWKNAGNDWCRAIWIECAEMADHYGWKWWKKQTPDTAQVHMELVDIFHFGLSKLILDRESAGNIFVRLVDFKSTSYSFLERVEHFVANVLDGKVFPVRQFAGLMSGVDMTFDDLYRQYVGKNVLNFFRQDHGYKTGEYRKHFSDGREDNEHLVEILNELPADSPTFKDDVYAALATRYEA